MKKIIFKTYLFLLAATLLIPVMPPTQAIAESVNLIQNPSVEQESNNQPNNWSTNKWGTNTASFAYESTGYSGDKCLSVTVSGYGSGDAKWMADRVDVVPGQSYTYTDYSKSSVETELDAAFTDAAGNISYQYLKSIPASTDWQQVSTTFTVPTGIVSVSIYHIIYSNGTLQTDEYSLIQNPVTTPSPTTPPPSPTPAPTDNLIPNDSFELDDGNDPMGWHRGGWGTNTPTFTYDSGSAHSGDRSVRVSLASVSSGDVKWFADPVAVTGGQSYTYQDYYMSSIETRVVAAMTDSNGVESYSELAAAPSSSEWSLYSTAITVPSGIKSLVVYHLLDKVGTLTIDDVSLSVGVSDPNSAPSPSPDPTTNLIPNASFETTNGTKPAGWLSEKWGTNTATFTYVQNDGHTGTHSSKITMSGYSSGDAKWYFTPLTNLTPGSQYSFSAWYKTNTQAHVVATYVDGNGSDQYVTLPNPISASDASTTWQQYKAILDIPSGATSVSIFFLLSSNGWLQTDDFSLLPYMSVGFASPIISLTFDDGWSSIYTNGLPLLQKYGLVSTQYLISGKLDTPDYMTSAMVKTFQSAGNEIGSHSVTHPDLTRVSATKLKTEVANSQATLRQLFGANVAQTFASPTGTYNASTLASIQKYYQSHRSTDVGFNRKGNFNPYNILVQNVTTSTTLADVAEWIAKAKVEKSWLVIVYHAVTNDTSSDEYSVSPANLDAQLNAIKASGISVKTISDAVAEIKTQL